jgi:hypothetical protein
MTELQKVKSSVAGKDLPGKRSFASYENLEPSPPAKAKEDNFNVLITFKLFLQR